MAKRGTTNPQLAGVIVLLKKTKKRVYAKAAEELERPSRQRVAVSLGRVSRYAEDGDVVLVPGKVLSGGELGKKIRLAAFQWSAAAAQKAKLMRIQDLVKAFPDGKGVKIIK